MGFRDLGFLIPTSESTYVVVLGFGAFVLPSLQFFNFKTDGSPILRLEY